MERVICKDVLFSGLECVLLVRVLLNHILSVYHEHIFLDHYSRVIRARVHGVQSVPVQFGFFLTKHIRGFVEWNLVPFSAIRHIDRVCAFFPEARNLVRNMVKAGWCGASRAIFAAYAYLVNFKFISPNCEETFPQVITTMAFNDGDVF